MSAMCVVSLQVARLKEPTCASSTVACFECCSEDEVTSLLHWLCLLLLSLFMPEHGIMAGPHTRARKASISVTQPGAWYMHSLMFNSQLVMQQCAMICSLLCQQAALQGGLKHDRLEQLLKHLEGVVPPCMSTAPDWEAVEGWLDELVPMTDSLPLPSIPDPSQYKAAISARPVSLLTGLAVACPPNTFMCKLVFCLRKSFC